MSRKFPRQRSLVRKRASVNPKLEIWVYCEGKKTEPVYLKDFRQDHASHLVAIEIVAAAGVPVTLVSKACEKMRELRHAARKSQNSFDKRFQVWGVTDVDDHKNLLQAKRTAQDSGIKLVISNPCFELWALLHFQEHDAPDHRNVVKEKLKACLCHRAGSDKVIDYSRLRNSYAAAKARAQRINARRAEEANPGGNPSTTMYELLELIIENGRRMETN